MPEEEVDKTLSSGLSQPKEQEKFEDFDSFEKAARSKAKFEFTEVKKSVFKAVVEDAKKGATKLKLDAQLGKEVSDLSKINSLALGKKINDKKEELEYDTAKELSKNVVIKKPIYKNEP